MLEAFARLGEATGYPPGALRGLAAVGNGPCFPAERSEAAPLQKTELRVFRGGANLLPERVSATDKG
jgi:hypothetical protein